MDLLSTFLSLHTVTTTLDWRCELTSPWRLVNEGTDYGKAPYHLIVAGNAWLEVKHGERLALGVGDIIVLPHGSPHTLHSGDKDARLPEMLPATVTALGNLKTDGMGPRTDVLCGEFVLDPKQSHLLLQSLPEVLVVKSQDNELHRPLYQVLQMLKHETQAQMPGSSIIAEHLSSALFSLLVRAWVSESGWQSNLLGLLAEPRLAAAAQHLLNHPDKVLSLAELARLCHMSRATFIRLFMNVTGQSPAALITTIRLMQAGKLLVSSKLPIGTIAQLVGYASETAFYRVFKRKMKMSPGMFRKNSNKLATEISLQ